MKQNEGRILYFYVVAFIGVFVVGGIVLDGFDAIRGVVALQLRPARLLSDFFADVGVGAGLVNAGLVGAFGLIFVAINGVSLSGPTVAGIFTMVGFGLFGKTPVNSASIYVGVAIAAAIAGKQFSAYIIIAMFGTALAPIVNTVAVELLNGPAAWIAGIVGGIVVGILLPPAAITMLRLHQGYSLYNIGLTSGFLGVFAAAVLRASVDPFPSAPFSWLTDVPSAVTWFIPAWAFLTAAVAFAVGGRSTWSAFLRIRTLSGRLPSDFFDMIGLAGGLLNMAFMALFSWGVVIAVGAPVNGPVLGGILTVVGFSSFGNHPRNSWPVVAGVIAAALLFGVSPAAPAAILAILFVTTLAPLAGEFGWIVGLIAGFVHLLLVLQTGAWHAGITLYNNGFAGGLTATLIVAVIEWYQSNRDTPFGKDAK